MLVLYSTVQYEATSTRQQTYIGDGLLDPFGLGLL